jgi:hypothetical protein
MFARTKKSGKYEYLQIVENHREGHKGNQRVIATPGRLEVDGSPLIYDLRNKYNRIP